MRSMRPRSSVARFSSLGAEQRAQVVVVHDATPARRRGSGRRRAPPARSGAARPPGSAAPAATASAPAARPRCAPRAAAPRARPARACRSSSAPCRSPWARARASASACHSCASSRSRAASARSVAARVSSSASVASMRAGPRLLARRDRRAGAPASGARSAGAPSACVAATLSVVSSPIATSTSSAERRRSARAARPRAPRRSSTARPSSSSPAIAATSRCSFSSRATAPGRRVCARQLLRAASRRRCLPRTAPVEILLQPEQRHLVGAQRRRRLSSARDRSAAACFALDLPRQRGLRDRRRAAPSPASSSRISRFCSSTPASADSREPPVTTPCGSITSPSSVTMVFVGVRLAPQRQRALQILDDQHVAEQVGRDLVVLPVVADQLEHRPAHAVALRPGGGDRVAVDGGDRTSPRRPSRTPARRSRRRRTCAARRSRVRAQRARDERRSALARALEELDRLDARLVRVDDDVAQSLAQHRLDGGLQLRAAAARCRRPRP